MFLLKYGVAAALFIIGGIGQLQAALDWAREPSSLQLVGLALIAMGVVDWAVRTRRKQKGRQSIQHWRRSRNSRRRPSHVSQTYTPDRRRGARRAGERSAQPSQHSL